MHWEKDLKDNKDNSRHLGRKYAGIFVLGHYLFLVAHSFPFSEQIMSADKYPCIFSRQMEAIVYIFSRQMVTIVYIFPNFENCASCEKDLKDNRENNLHLGRKYVRIFVLGCLAFYLSFCFPRASLSEQIMSAGKYPSIFSRQIATIVFLSEI